MENELMLTGKKRNQKVETEPDLKYLEIQEVIDLFQDLPIEIAMYDLNGKYKFINKLYCEDEQIRSSIIGKNDEYFFDAVGISPNSIKKRKENFTRALKEKRMIRFTEKLYLPEQDKTLYYKRHFKPIFSDKNNEKISRVFLFGNNVSATILGQKELIYLAYHDKLTGLKNREAFYDQLNQIIVDSERDIHQKSIAVLYCDLDNFKLVNDSLGHIIGDKALKEIASRLKLCLRKSDHVFRVGGDEFILVLKNINHEYDAGKVASKITNYLSSPFYIENHKIAYLTTSIGIVLFPKDGQDVETLVQNADSAMYMAKKKGKNNFQFYSKAMTENSIRRLKIEKNLSDIIHKNSFEDQFEILYQPIVEKKINGEYKVIGSEALLRWKNPELGVVNPSTFIPIAEDTNLITELGDWIFYKACDDYKTILTNVEVPLYLSINFSAKQLRSSNMIKKIERILRSTKYDPARLQLELTETSYLDDHFEVVRNISELENIGVRLVLDDFGVGFASLSYLHKVPAATIKIDKSFIRYLSASPKHKELVRSIIMLGQNLNKDIIAEGVEQVEDLYLLDALQCYKYQGFLFSMPVSLSKLEKLVNKESLLTTIIS